MTSDARLNGKVALVTGAPKKLGACIARTLASAGVKIAINYLHSADDANGLVAAIKSAGGEAVALQADIADLKAARGLLDGVQVAYGGLDILVNNTGPWTDVALKRLTPDNWDMIMNTNVRATWYLAREAFPGMNARGWGRIINISAADAHVRNHAVYGLAKSSVETLTAALALEFAPRVTVNAIAPGMIDDPEVPDEYRSPVAEHTPLKRLVTFDDVAAMALTICSPTFDIVTGQVVVMDGGLSIPTDPRTYDQ